jgi:hypothetical protein
MKRSFAFWLCCLISTAAAGQDEPDAKAAAAKAAIVQEIRELITWHDEEQTSPNLNPEQVFGLLPVNELPIPKEDQGNIGAWIVMIRDWRADAETCAQAGFANPAKDWHNSWLLLPLVSVLQRPEPQ